MRLDLAPCGEAAARLVVAEAPPEEVWRIVHHVAESVHSAAIPGVHGAVPTYDSLLLEFDASVQSFDSIAPLLELLGRNAVTAPDADPAPAAQHFTVPVVYGGRFGPDLGFIADHLELSEAEVITLHTAQERVVRCLGGPAASAMTDGPDFAKPIPRLPDPRLEVPANAVSLAGVQGVLGPVRSPSGWRLIGQSPVQVLDMAAPTLVPYRPGDYIRFLAIGEDEWQDYDGRYLREMTTR